MANKLSAYERLIKRSFDIVLSLVGLIFTFWIIIIAYMIAAIETKSNGFFRQERVGLNGRLFKVIKIKTMKKDSIGTTITTKNDVRITTSGFFFRRTKVDELPQLINVLKGDMSFVGPRPDVPGYADKLIGEDRMILSIRPGITGPATLKYRNEEEILAKQQNPQKYNDEIIFPDKMQINKEYIRNYTFISDIKYIIQTIF